LSKRKGDWAFVKVHWMRHALAYPYAKDAKAAAIPPATLRSSLNSTD